MKINTAILSPKDDNKHLRKMYLKSVDSFPNSLKICNAFNRNFDAGDMKTIHMITKFLKVFETNKNRIDVNEKQELIIKSAQDCVISRKDLSDLYQHILDMWNKNLYFCESVQNVSEKVQCNFGPWFNGSVSYENKEDIIKDYLNKIHALNEMLNFLQTNTSFKIKIKKDYLKADKRMTKRIAKARKKLM